MSEEHKQLEMKIELAVIEDLGIRLYSRLPQVLAEVVANAWDADATAVHISLHEGEITPNSKIVIKDNGHGMTYKDIGDKFLRVGRKRRVVDGNKTKGGKRCVIGRKGIGKLAVFGIARMAKIRTVCEGKMGVFQMNVDAMLKEAQKTGKYKPNVICASKDTDRENGTTIILTNLTRKTKINAQSVRRGIAKHFTIIGNEFCVSVNDKQIVHSDKFVDSVWEKKWDINEPVSDEESRWIASGWIGATKQPLVEEDRGITIMARGKLIQSPTLFGIKSGSKYSYSYITGEIQADFCDDEVDSIATDRHSIMDTPQGRAIRKWGENKLTKISDELTAMRKVAREKEIREDTEIKPWLDSLNASQNKIADKIIHVVTSNNNLNNDKRKDLIHYAKASFEQTAFLEMVSTLDERPDPATLLELFEECNMVEARELERIVKSRLETIDLLVKFMNDNDKEVPTLHDYFKKSPWMLDPAWTQWQDEVRYSSLLKEKFSDSKLKGSDRRIDFLAIGVGDTVHVIELKRPQYQVRGIDVQQLANYVGFVKNHLGNDPNNGYRDVAGYLVIGRRSNDPGVRELISMSEKSRYYIRTYDDLVVSAKRLHKHFEDKLIEFDDARS